MDRSLSSLSGDRWLSVVAQMRRVGMVTNRPAPGVIRDSPSTVHRRTESH